ncbi:hypothetical protein [Pseudochryseolinea flava]|uniref:SIR2-like domain-containing protein n=1 Tax=Pseudochryseolinea flava TaxID=2059302 RepID=A0A364Y5C7_9BACT|nr:hypothetical protein [Pseudochryseolinea flava]RAW01561.1 hypothetical protein DQQ10_07840 [Pseudochryseolinea flava]
MKPTVSFLLGSGFSIPEGLPGVKKLNSRLSKIDESEILIHTDQRALFLRGQKDPNRWSRADERMFVQEFLEFYNAEVLRGKAEFHYETFYDFYSGYLYKKENKDLIENFCDNFNKKHFKENSPYQRDCHNRINDFNRTFNQLLASELHKTQYLEDVTTLNYPLYGSFIAILKKLLENCDIKVHTLNHDLFFDWLGRHHADLWEHFSDGFQLEGSPFYGTVEYEFNQNTNRPKVKKSYYVKLEYFADKFDKPLSLFKLHGSVFNTIIYTPEPQKRVRLKDNYAIHQYYIETKDEKTGEYKFQFLWDEVAPDFLSGTTNKTRYYTSDPYYKNLLEHFEKNLKASEFLIVVGYGFQDPGINEYLEKYFLSLGKKMLVIDPHRPQTDLLEKYEALHIAKGVTEVTRDEYLEIIPANLK